MVQTFQTTIPVRDEIKEMVRRIGERFDPAKIVLFGSHARGDAGPDSDADILVIMSVKGSRRKKATEIDVALIGIDLPADIIVITPDEAEKNLDAVGGIIRPALTEGKVLYERTR